MTAKGHSRILSKKAHKAPENRLELETGDWTWEFLELRKWIMGLKETMTWDEISKLPGLNDIPMGTIERTAKGREPRDPILRMKLHLPPLLETCGLCYRITEERVRAHRREDRRNRRRKIADMSPSTLRVLLENREEFV